MVATTSEKGFLSTVSQFARLHGWKLYHTHDSRGSECGFPDLVLLHPKRRQAIVVELKVGNRRPTTEQHDWLEAFSVCGVASYWWNPDCWEEIEEVLG